MTVFLAVTYRALGVEPLMKAALHRPYGAGIAPVENGTPGPVDFRILSGKTL